jgi:hypothetical protein
MIQSAPGAFIFMKVGNHASETFEQILERKKQEYEKAGKIFWGYGGPTCHPLNHIQPFVHVQEQKNGSVYVLMQEIDSRANPAILPARQYSVDGVTWEDLPQGIDVRGSRYALVLDEITTEDFEINLQNYEIGVGPSATNNAAGYLRGHVDKACLVQTTGQPAPTATPKIKKIKLVARLVKPYAVLLKD